MKFYLKYKCSIYDKYWGYINISKDRKTLFHTVNNEKLLYSLKEARVLYISFKNYHNSIRSGYISKIFINEI